MENHFPSYPRIVRPRSHRFPPTDLHLRRETTSREPEVQETTRDVEHCSHPSKVVTVPSALALAMHYLQRLSQAASPPGTSRAALLGYDPRIRRGHVLLTCPLCSAGVLSCTAAAAPKATPLSPLPSLSLSAFWLYLLPWPSVSSRSRRSGGAAGSAHDLKTRRGPSASAGFFSALDRSTRATPSPPVDSAKLARVGNGLRVARKRFRNHAKLASFPSTPRFGA